MMADDELTMMRAQFVRRVSEPMISQLLDHVLMDRILSLEQYDCLMTNTTADKARHLIDTVGRQGSRASQMLIAHIQRIDPCLYAQLSLSCEQPVLPAAELPMGEVLQFILSMVPSVIEKLKEMTRKTDEGSKNMIANIKCKDPKLYSKLVLPSGQTALPAAEPQMQQERLDLVMTSPVMSSVIVSVIEKLHGKNIYPVTEASMRNRVALLITNIEFADDNFNRFGADKDEKNMKDLLESLGYEVVKHTNLTGEGIDAAVDDFSKHRKLRETDSVVVVIMSHGMDGAVFGVDYKIEFPLKNICKHLGPEKCTALLNKPKIVIIQACRGEEDGSVPVRDGANAAELYDDADKPGQSSSAVQENKPESSGRHVHKEKDFIFFLSCTPDTASWRHPVNGSYLIQFVVEVFKNFARKDHIEALFKKVQQRFEDFSISNTLQMPAIERNTLTKDFYFFTGE